jgi:hypothetical protein
MRLTLNLCWVGVSNVNFSTGVMKVGFGGGGGWGFRLDRYAALEGALEDC